MPLSTLLVLGASWILLALLTLAAYRFNRDRGHD